MMTDEVHKHQEPTHCVGVDDHSISRYTNVLQHPFEQLSLVIQQQSEVTSPLQRHLRVRNLQKRLRCSHCPPGDKFSLQVQSEHRDLDSQVIFHQVHHLIREGISPEARPKKFISSYQPEDTVSSSRGFHADPLGSTVTSFVA
jgi:hypothetical protein